MNRLGTGIRLQVILVTIVSLLVLALILVTISFFQQRNLLIASERRTDVTLINSVNNTINAVRAFITTLRDIEEMNTRLAELVQLNDNIDFIAVTDANGSVIFHSDPQYQDTTVSQLSLLPTDETILKSVPGFDEVYLTALTFDSEGLVGSPQYQVVVASASEPVRDQLIRDALSSLIVTALFALAAASVIITLLQYYFVRPIELLSQTAKAIEAGDLTQQVKIKQRNEVGQLADNFNRMTLQLASLINQLEERVQERTRELEIARDYAEQASRAKSDFLSNMSHELRTPLNMVIGYTSSMLTMPQMYNNVPLPEIYLGDIQLIRDSGKHLLSLINDILDLSKIEAGKLVMNFSAVDLNSSFESAIAISLGLIGNKPLQLRQNYPENLPKIWADNIRLRQILLNLLSNAIKYTETGSVTLFAEVRDANVYIAVIDTGPGIPESALSTIFDRFEQIQTKSEVQGTGLGLDISQRLAQLHDSAITIETTPGTGSTFALTLPIATEAQLSMDSGTSAPSVNTEYFRQDTAHQLMSLVVATDQETRQQLRRALEAQGVVVVEAHDRERAIDLASGLLPDLILLDVEIQTAEVEAIVHALQANSESRNIPLVFIRNAADGSIMGTNGAKAVIHKPIVQDEVSRVIQTLFKTSN